MSFLQFFDLSSLNECSHDRARKIATLKDSYNSWAEWKHISKEATHATKILGAMLRNIAVLEPQLSSSNPCESLESISRVDSPPSSGIYSGGLDDIHTNGSSEIQFDQQLSSTTDIWPFDNVFEGSENFDWVSKVPLVGILFADLIQ